MMAKASHSEAFHKMMDRVMGDDQRITLSEAVERANNMTYGPYSEDRLLEKVRASKSDENGEGFAADRFHGKWQIERYC